MKLLRDEVATGIPLKALLTKLNIAVSVSNAERFIEGGAVKVNGAVVKDINYFIPPEVFKKTVLTLEVGRNHFNIPFNSKDAYMTLCRSAKIASTIKTTIVMLGITGMFCSMSYCVSESNRSNTLLKIKELEVLSRDKTTCVTAGKLWKRDWSGEINCVDK